MSGAVVGLGQPIASKSHASPSIWVNSNQIEQGVYLTDEKLDAAVNELLDDIDL